MQGASTESDFWGISCSTFHPCDPQIQWQCSNRASLSIIHKFPASMDGLQQATTFWTHPNRLRIPVTSRLWYANHVASLFADGQDEASKEVTMLRICDRMGSTWSSGNQSVSRQRCKACDKRLRIPVHCRSRQTLSCESGPRERLCALCK